MLSFSLLFGLKDVSLYVIWLYTYFIDFMWHMAVYYQMARKHLNKSYVKAKVARETAEF